MIEIKNSSNSILKESVITLDDAILNNSIPQQYAIAWDGSIIVYITILNNASVDFTSINLKDASNNNLVHSVGTHVDCYSICFSSDGSTNPLSTASITDLNTLYLTWSYPGLAVGSITVKIYSKHI